MGKTGRIAAIKKEFNSTQLQTMQSGLANKGLTRVPGTGVFKYPFKERTGKYRTGLDPEAAYILRIQDPIEKSVEIDRVKALKAKLESALGGVDLGPYSKFWNYSFSSGTDDTSHVQPVKLMDGDNYFDLSNPIHELQYTWLKVHPTIASSLEAYYRGEFPAETQWYVADEEAEARVAFKKKTVINKAIARLSTMTPETRKKVARLLGLPVTDNDLEESVYVQLDNILKQTEFKAGKYQGLNPVEVFNRFSEMDSKILDIKDLIKQALTHSVYKEKSNGKIYKGEFEVAGSEEELVKFLADEDNQKDKIMLEQEVISKKLALV